MHELGIIIHIAKTLDDIAVENELEKIGSVTLEIGEVSGIVPDYLTECWDYYRKKNPLMAEAEMRIEILPATTFCEACKKTYPTVAHGRICPHCGSEETYLLAGNECNIKEIEAC
ncbi:MAG: hydrogenase maturation nickel metallochaperone HypA [Clostridiales bacterium]|nr:hydrogenase maturation nickel metallochaperone HypA [Roseburia sp.]MDD7637003.1 hydrogenase maturation nickel metallochaperone HypA [Clostridiales bacterium]MDY4112467.1 hydrogenase maturation nickel metallochaperone HypA [Roseburia sp.]